MYKNQLTLNINIIFTEKNYKITAPCKAFQNQKLEKTYKLILLFIFFVKHVNV